METMLTISVAGDVAVESVEPDRFTKFANEFVGGWYRGICLPSVVILERELAQLDGMPLNRVATNLLWELGGDRGDFLCGDVVVCGAPCETVSGLDARRLEELTTRLGSIKCG